MQPQGEWMYAVGGGESGYIAPDPKDANIFYAGSQGAMLTRYDRRDGQEQDVQPYPFFFSGQSASTLKERWQWTFPIVYDPLAPGTIYTSSQHLFKTTNGGKSWAILRRWVIRVGRSRRIRMGRRFMGRSLRLRRRGWRRERSGRGRMMGWR